MADKGTGVASEAAAKDANTVSQPIDAKIASLGDWRGETLARIRNLIHEADPDVIEEVRRTRPECPSGRTPGSSAPAKRTGTR